MVRMHGLESMVMTGEEAVNQQQPRAGVARWSPATAHHRRNLDDTSGEDGGDLRFSSDEPAIAASNDGSNKEVRRPLVFAPSRLSSCSSGW
nr:hypothetical protein Iba_chr05cCG13170 [Ipomoea batatas]GMC95919.1 hypothetical protein Iba_chr05cCG13180 [Ipomoea batatas]GME00977.1 hypothetical protein Iba_contig675CG0010 [Ipomoea batatas]